MPQSFPPQLGLLLAVPVIAFWLWMFSDMMKNDRLPSGERDTWTLAFIFLSIFTAAYYYVYVYRNRN